MSPLIFCLLVCGVFIGVSGKNEEEEDVFVPVYEIGATDDFDWKLLKTLSGPDFKNVLISPLSIKLIMALLYEGSGGITEQELHTIVGFNLNKTIVTQEYSNILSSLLNNKNTGCTDSQQENVNKNYRLSIGTRMFLDAHLQPQQSFQAKVCAKYQTEIEPTNFNESIRTRDRINRWVNQITFGKIKKLVEEDEVKQAVLLIANAVYFKGLWREQFPKNQSYTGGFYLSPTQVVPVPYMSATNDYYFINSKQLDAKFIRLPYKGGRYSMIVGLPNSKAGLSDLIQKLNINSLRNNLNLMDKISVDLYLPKFQFEFQARLVNLLKQLGIVTLFENTASLAGIHRGHNANLVVSDIIQKSGIEINEEGSTAYASTAVHIGNKFGDSQTIFNASHPFLFFIEDQTTRTILFMGKIENPLEMEAMPFPTRFGESTENNYNFNSEVPQVVPQSSFGQAPLQLNPTWNDQDVAGRFNFIDLEILRELSSKDDNVFISPASIKTTLGMLLEGSVGLCREEIVKALRLPVNVEEIRNQLRYLLYELTDKNQNSILEAANGIFVSTKLTLIEGYKKIIQNFYGGSVENVNFGNVQNAAQIINRWVSNATRGLIPQIVGGDNLQSSSSIVVANALYFKGMWLKEFEEKSTKIKCFTLPSRQCLNVYMMQNTADMNYATVDLIDAHALELPYSDDKYAMLILLPKIKNNIQALIKDIQHVQFSNIVDKLEKMEVVFEIPRFVIDYTTDLVRPLKQLGIREIFSDTANLSGIVYNTQVHIDNIMHKARVEVNERGTIAAAATGAVVIPLMGSSSPRVIADHPFVFFIYRKDNKNILFEGIVNRPTEAIVAPTTRNYVPGSNFQQRQQQQVYRPIQRN